MKFLLAACLVALAAAVACTSGSPSMVDADMAVGGQASAIQDVEPTTECNNEFLGLGQPVHDAVDESNKQLHELFDAQFFSVDAWEKQHPVAADEFAAIWNNIKLHSGVLPKQMLGNVADLWHTFANTPFVDSDTRDEVLESIAEAYEELAVEFEKCDTTEVVVYRLRGEAQFLQLLAGNW